MATDPEEDLPIPGTSPEDYADPAAPDTASDELSAPQMPDLSPNPRDASRNVDRIVDFAQRSEAFDARQKAREARQAEMQARRERNAAARKTADETGAQFITDAQGDYQPAIDPETGKQKFTPRTSPVRYDKEGRPYQVRTDETGTRTVSNPDADAEIGENPDDPTDPYLYRKNKATGWEPIDPQEGIRSADRRVVAASARFLHKRELQKVESERADLALKLQDPARPRALTEKQRAELALQRESLATPLPPPEPKTSFFGVINQEATAQAQAAYMQEEDARKKQLADLDNALALDDERQVIEKQAYDLALRQKQLRDAGPAGFLQILRQQQAAEVSALPPEQARARIEQDAATIAQEDQDLASRQADIQARADALTAEMNNGVSFARSAEIDRERASLTAEAESLTNAVASRNAKAEQIQTNVRAVQEKQTAERAKQIADLRNDPDTAPMADAIDQMDREYAGREKDVATMPDGPEREAATAALTADRQKRLQSVEKEIEGKISGKVQEAITRHAGPGGPLGFKAQIAAIEKDETITPTVRKVAARAIRENAIDAMIRTENMRQIGEQLPPDQRLDPENPEHRERASQMLDQDPGLGARVWDGFDRVMTTLGARTFGALGTPLKALGETYPNTPGVKQLGQLGDKLYQTKKQAEGFRDKYRDPRTDEEGVVNRWIMPAVSEALPNLAGILTGPFNIAWSAGQLFDEGYSQADQDPALSPEQKRSAAAIYTVLGIGPELAGDYLTGGFLNTRSLPKAAKQEAVGKAVTFLQKSGKIWDRLPPEVKRAVGILAAGGGEGVTEVIQDKILNATIEAVKTGKVADAIESSIADNRATLDTFIIASLSGGGIKLIDTIARTAAERGEKAVQGAAERFAAVNSAFPTETLAQNADSLGVDFDAEAFATLTQQSDAIRERIAGVNPRDTLVRNELSRTLLEVEAQRSAEISRIIAGFDPNQAPAGGQSTRLRPEQRAAAEAQIQNWQPGPGIAPAEADLERNAARGALKILSGQPVESLLSAERAALDSRMRDKSRRMEMVRGVPVITDGQLRQLRTLSPVAASLPLRDEAATRSATLANENAKAPQQQGAPANPPGPDAGTSGANRPATADPAGKLPPLPVGKAGGLLTPRELDAAKQITRRLTGRGVPQNEAAAFSRYIVRRDGSYDMNEARIEGAVQEFEAAGGTQNAPAIMAAIQAGESAEGEFVAAEHDRIISSLRAQPKKKGVRHFDDLDETEQRIISNVLKRRILPAVSIYRGAFSQIDAGMDAETPTLVTLRQKLAGLERQQREQTDPAKLVRISQLIDETQTQIDQIAGSSLSVGSNSRLILNAGALLRREERASYSDAEIAERTIQEEVAHVLQVKIMADAYRARTGRKDLDDMTAAFAEAEDIWTKLPRAMREAVIGIRDIEMEGEGARGMEFFRMLLQHDLALGADGKLRDRNGVLLTEQSAPNPLLSRIETLFRRFIAMAGKLDQILAKTFKGTPEESAAFRKRVTDIREKSVAALRDLKKSADAARSAAYQQEYEARGAVDPKEENAAPGNAGGVSGRDGRTNAGTSPVGGPGTGPGVSSGATSAPADSALAAQLAERDKTIARLEAEKAEREAAAERAQARRNLAVQRRAENTLGDTEKILAAVPEDARSLAEAELARVQIGAPTYVLGANRERLPASYVAAAPGAVQTSHIGGEFRKNPAYGGENTRRYDTDETEQNKVRAIAMPGALDEDSIVTDAKSAADGPAQVVLAVFNDAEGNLRVSLQTAGGNGREQGVNLAPLDDQERLSAAWADRGEQFGLSAMPEGWRGYRFLGVYDLRQEDQSRAYQSLVDKLNPSQGVVQDTAARADIDAALNIPVDRLVDIPLTLSPEAARDVMVGLVRDAEKLGLDRNLVSGLARNPSQAQFYVQRLLIASAFRSRALGEFFASAQWSSGHATVSGLIKSATSTALRLRQKGHGNIAEAIGRTLERVAENVKAGRKLNLAIRDAADQQEIGEDGPIIQAIATALSSKVAFHPQRKNGIVPVDAEETQAGFEEFFTDLGAAVQRFSAEPDMFGAAPSIAETINAAIAAHFRKSPAVGETTLSAKGARGPSATQPWPENFPQIVPQTTGTNLKNHPDYFAAKGGDTSAAQRLVFSLANETKIQDLARRHPDATIVPVHAEERSGKNKIPRAFADYISVATGLAVDTEIVQSNKVGHTGADMASRFLARAEFNGSVIAGQEYILVDDFVTTGGTLSDLRRHIESGGGKVVEIASMANSFSAQHGSSGQIAILPEIAVALNAKFGQTELREFLAFHGLQRSVQSLTNVEGKWLLRFGSLDAARNSLSARRQQKSESQQSGRVQENAAAVKRKPPEPQFNRPRRIRELHRKRQTEGLTRWESDELTALERASGQGFLDYFDQTLDDRFQLESEIARRAMAPAPVEQLTLLATRKPGSPSLRAAEQLRAKAQPSAERLVKAVRSAHAEAQSQRDGFLSDVETAARRAGGKAKKDAFPHAVKKLGTAVEKLNRKPKVPSDLLRATVISPARTPEGVRAHAAAFVSAMARAGYSIYAPGGKPDIDDRFDGSVVGYKDIALKFVRDTETPDPIVKEVLILQPAMAKAKARFHVAYGKERAIRSELKKRREENTLTPELAKTLYKKALFWQQEHERISSRAYSADNDFGSIPNARKVSSESFLNDAISSSISRISSPEMYSSSPLSSTDRALLITPSDTQADGDRQRITSANIAAFAGQVDVSALAANKNLAAAFELNREELRSGAVQIVPIETLVSLKNELEDPKFLAGNKKDPRQTAADWMVKAIRKDPEAKRRAPLDVTDNGDGTYTIVDGNATAQAAMLAGWKKLPIRVLPRAEEQLSAKGARSDAAHLAAVQRGDMAEAQRLTDSAARAAGANPDIWFHNGTLESGTPRVPFYLVRNKEWADSWERGTTRPFYVFGRILENPNPLNDDVWASPYSEDFQNRLLREGYIGISDPLNEENAQLAVVAPNAIKSADPVTYDAAGNVIPLSQRFNPANDNVLYAKNARAVSSDQLDFFAAAQPEIAAYEAALEQDGITAPAAKAAAAQADLSLPASAAVDLFGNPLTEPAPKRRTKKETRRESQTRQPSQDLFDQGISDAGQGGTSPGPDETGSREGSQSGNPPPVERDGRPDRPPLVNRPQDPNARNHVIADGDEVAPRSTSDKYAANLAAIRLLYELREQKRNATPEEKRVLARYTGWGWAGEYFNPENPRYAKQYQELKDLLLPEDFEAARASTTNAHYTDLRVIDAMWKVAKRLGFKGGTVLEPAGGVGHFFGRMPQEFADLVRLQGVELDSISGDIFSALYPEAEIQASTGFQEARIRANSVDLAISNVPFGNYKVPGAKDYPELLIHDYFFARTLDKVRPGGLVVFITSDGTMDKGDKKVRELLAQKADLVGAIRLPNNAFAENAGTQVTTDIIILRKKDGKPFEGQNWLNRTEVGTQEIDGKQMPIRVNQYYDEHPEMALGRHSLEGSMYAADDYALVARPGQDTIDLLDKAIASLPENVIESTGFRPAAATGDSAGKLAEGGQKEGSYITEGGNFYQVIDGRLETAPWLTMRNYGDADRVEEPITEEEQLKRRDIARDWLALRETALELINSEILDGVSEEQLESLRRRLNAGYDAYVKKWGTLTRVYRHLEKAAFLEDDPEYPLMQALENEIKVMDKKDQKLKPSWVKADIFRRRIRTPRSMPDRVETVDDAINTSLSFDGGIYPATVARLMDITEDEAREKIVASGRAFVNPETGLFESRERYLSGNVRRKLTQAEAAAAEDPAFEPNAAALREALPKDVSLSGIYFSLASRWIPNEIHSLFTSELLGTRAEVQYVQAANRFTITLEDNKTPENETTYAASKTDGRGGSVLIMRGRDLLMHALNGTEPVINRPKVDANGNPVLNDKGDPVMEKDIEAIQNARRKMAEINRAFTTFIKTTTATVADGRSVQEAVERQYNDTQNAVVPASYSGDYLVEADGKTSRIPGLSETVWMNGHRRSVVARILQEGSAVMAHGVGSGKTFSQIVAAMEMRRLGLARKPMVVVQKATIGQFAKSVREAYPGARVLVANEKNFSAKNRKRFLGQIATGDYDMVIVTQPQFDRILPGAGTIRAYFSEKLAALEAAKRESAAASGKRDPKTKELETAKRRLEAKMERMLSGLKERGDDVLTFEQTGVDALLIDEAHAYKKTSLVTNMRQVRGIPNDESQRAMGLEIKAKMTQDKNNGRNVILATGTPITNSMAEAYIMLKLATPHVLESYGIDNFDDFARTFGEAQTKLEYSWSGKWKMATRFNRFVNGPELIAMIRSGFDVKMGNKALGLKVPEQKHPSGEDKPEIVVVPQTSAMEEITQWILDIADTYEDVMKNGSSDEKQAAMAVPIVTMQAGMAAALDPRLINPSLADDPNSKVNTAMRSVAEIYRETTDRKGTQVIFCDRFKPMNTQTLDRFAGGQSESMDVDEEDTQTEEESEDESEKSELSKLEDQEFKSGGFNLYQDMREKLVAQGIPREEIAIVHEFNTDIRRAELFSAINAGRIRVVIGSTEKLGVGVNMQERMVAMHHLDPPRMMTPAMMEQRNGRGIRQGNLFLKRTLDDGTRNPLFDPEFKIYNRYYATEKSMDTGIYQMLENKSRFIAQALSGEGVGRAFEDAADELTASMAQIKAMSTGDTRVIRMAELQGEMDELEAERVGFEDEKAATAKQLANSKKRILYLRSEAQKVLAALPAYQAAAAEDAPFQFEIDGQTYEDREAAEGAVSSAMGRMLNMAMRAKDGKATIPYTYKGIPGALELQMSLDGKSVSHQVTYIPDPLGGWSNLRRQNFESASQAFPSLKSALNTFEGHAEFYEKEIGTIERQIPAMEAKMGETWSRKAEYAQKAAELAQIQRSLLSNEDAQQEPTPAAPEETLQAKRKSVDARTVETYLHSKGAPRNAAVRETSERISRTLSLDAAGGVAEAGRYTQGDLFAQPEDQTLGQKTADLARRAAVRPNQAAARSEDRLTPDLVAGFQGDWAALAREVDRKGRASSILADLVEQRIPSWDITGTRIDSPRDVLAVMQPIRSPYFESLKVMVVDGNYNAVYSQILHVGSVNESIADPKRIFAQLAAIREKTGKAYNQIIISHNHPSGDPNPSQADHRLTRRIHDVAEAVGFTVVDHIITNGETFFSFREAGIDGRPSTEKPYKPRKDTGTNPPAMPQQAAWEVVPRSNLADMASPERVGEVAKFLRNGNPDALHVFYLNTRMRLSAVERISAADFLDAKKFNQKLLAGVAREGAYAVAIDVPKTMGTQMRGRHRALSDFASAAVFQIADIVQENILPGERSYFSYRESGLMEEPAQYLAAKRAVTDPNQTAFDFSEAPQDPAAATQDAAQDPIDRFRAELPNAIAIANTYKIDGVTADELRQTARIALADAARTFSADRKIPFRNFASIVVRNRLRDMARRQTRERQVVAGSLDEQLGPNGTETRGDQTADPSATQAPDAAARSEAVRLIEDALAGLPAPMQKILRGFNAGRSLDEIGQELGVSRQRVGFLQQEAFRRLRGRLGERGITSTAQLFAKPSPGADPIDDVFAMLEQEIEDMQEAALAEEVSGARKRIGRPDLAFGAANPDVRGADQVYTDKVFNPQTEAQWQAEADEMLRRDYAGTRRAIEQAGFSGQTLTPAQTKAAAQIAQDLRAKMLEPNAPETARRDFNRFWIAYRGTGTAAGRALAARRDPVQTPAERYQAFLMDLMLKPRPAAQREIDAAPSQAENEARIRQLESQLATARQQIDAAEVRRLEAELTAQRAQPTKEFLIDQETADLLAKLKAAGITPEDILRDRVTLRLADRKIVDEYLSLFAKGAPSTGDRAAKQRAFRMILGNRPFAEIAKATGLSEAAVRQIKAEFIAEMRRQHFAKFQAGAKADAATLITGTKVDDATAEKEFTKWLRGLGIVDDAKQGRPRFNIEDPAQVMRMARAIQAATRSGILDMAYEYWMMNILSGPATHFVNIAGNTLNAAWDMTVQRGMESLVNLAVRDSKSARLGEFRWLMKGLLPGITKGFTLAARAWSAEHDFYEHTVLGTPLEIDHFDKGGNTKAAIPGAAGRLIRVPGRALLFADSLFKMAIGQAEVGAQAYRMARAEGLKGKALANRIAQLSQTREQAIASRLPKAKPSDEMVEYFARALARKDDTLDADDLIADPSSPAWEMAREQTAYDEAVKAGWTDAAWQRAVGKSRELTFQQDLRRMNEGGNVVEDLASKLQEMRGDNLLLAFFFPFVRTPYNIFRLGIRKSPLGAANLLYQAGRGLYGLRKGKPYLNSHPEAVRDLAEQSIAWMAMALLFGAAQGDEDDDDKMVLITGSMPFNMTSRGERELQQRAYGGDYVVRIGGRNGISLAYGRYEPFATVLGTTIDTIRAIKSRGATADNMDALWGYMTAQAQSKTFLQGFADIAKGLEGSNNVAQGTGRFAMQAIVPNIIRQPLRNLDDYVRDSKRAGLDYQAFPAGNLSTPKVTIYGDDIQKTGAPVMRLFASTPLATDEELAAADRLLLRWNTRNPSESYAPQAPTDTYTRNGKEQKMTQAEYYRFSQLAGRNVRTLLRGKLPPARIENPTKADVEMVRSAFEEARAMARKRLFGG